MHKTQADLSPTLTTRLIFHRECNIFVTTALTTQNNTSYERRKPTLPSYSYNKINKLRPPLNRNNSNHPLTGVLIRSGNRVHLTWGMLQALYVAAATHQPTFERITPLIWFVRQLHSTLLANVAVYVEVFIHRNDAYCFFCSLYRGYT